MHYYRTIYVWLLVIVAHFTAEAQRHFSVSLQFPDSIQAKQIKVFYDNGINDNIPFTDTLTNNQLKLSGTYFSRFATIIIGHSDGAYRLWIDEKPASIRFQINNGKLDIVELVNAVDIDRSEPVKQITQFTSAEVKNIETFMSNNKEWYTKDSLIATYTDLNKILSAKKVEYVSKYPNTYYAFWLFRREIVYLDYDIQGLIKVYDQIFDDTLKATTEGREIAMRLNGRATTKGSRSLDFLSKGIKNEDVKLSDYRGKYVLITFWASWCGPCVAEFPQLKKFRNIYPADSLAFIFVSLDTDEEKFSAALKKYDLPGSHIYNDIEVLKRYGVMAIPQVYLIDKKGLVAYSRADQPDINLQILEKVLVNHLVKSK